MKRLNIVLPALLLAAACSSSTEMAAGSSQVELRVLGVGGSAYSAVLVEVKDLQVTTSDGRPLAVTGGHTQLDLARADQAWLAGRFDLPADVDEVDVKLTLDDFGGYEGQIGAGALDLRAAPIQFEASAWQLAGRNATTVQIDLKRAIVPVGAERAVLLPIATIVH